MPTKPSSREFGFVFRLRRSVWAVGEGEGRVILWHTTKEITSKWMVEGGNYPISQNWSPSTYFLLTFFLYPVSQPFLLYLFTNKKHCSTLLCPKPLPSGSTWHNLLHHPITVNWDANPAPPFLQVSWAAAAFLHFPGQTRRAVTSAGECCQAEQHCAKVCLRVAAQVLWWEKWKSKQL